MPPVSALLLVLVTACFAPRDDAPPTDDSLGACVPSSSVDSLGDGIDQDCDGVDGTDADRDGIPAAASGGLDCDDASPFTGPGATDIAGDDIDQNCDGVDGTDADLDGIASTVSGGLDCDDQDPEVIPTADFDADGFTACEDCDDQDPDAALGDIDGDGFTECDGDCAPTKAWLHPYDEDGDGVFEACGYRDVWCESSRGVALDSDGRPVPFGNSTFIVTPDVRYRHLGDDYSVPCGVTVDGEASCISPYGLPYDAPQVPALQVEYGITLLEDGHLARWGPTSSVQLPTGTFVAFGGALGGGIALSASGSIATWGSNSRPPPAASYTSISSGSDVHCGTSSVGAACWGSYTDSWTNVGAAGTFTSIKNSSWGACAQSPGGLLTCWGQNNPNYPPTDIPLRTYTLTPWGSGWVTSDGQAICTSMGSAP